MVRHGATEIGFISRTGSTQSKVLWCMVRLSRAKCQVAFTRVAPCRTRHYWSKFARFGAARRDL